MRTPHAGQQQCAGGQRARAAERPYFISTLQAMHGIVALCLPSGACPTAFPEQITQSEFRNGLSPPCRLT